MTHPRKSTPILLHACCAPCASHVAALLARDYAPTLFFFNPNIHPESEYRLRAHEIKVLADNYNLPLITGEYVPREWLDAIAGHEKDPEGGERCRLCFRYRLEKTAAIAASGHFPVFTTTLSVSPHKNAATINTEGRGAASGCDKISFLTADFKKNDGFRKSCGLSRQFGFYRQNYCGCAFSMRDRHPSRDELQNMLDQQK